MYIIYIKLTYKNINCNNFHTNDNKSRNILWQHEKLYLIHENVEHKYLLASDIFYLFVLLPEVGDRILEENRVKSCIAPKQGHVPEHCSKCI